VVGEALRLLGRRAAPAYAAAAVATLVNTVPDVLRQVLVWDDPSRVHALLVDVVGFLTGLAAQLWVTGAVARLATGGRGTWRGALPRGTALAWRAVRHAPGAVLAGVVLGGAVSAVLTLPASVAALGSGSVLGPLGAPPVGAFAVAAVSDAVASCVTLPFLALVLALAGGSARPPAGRSAR
jgi:hypothetical protein